MPQPVRSLGPSARPRRPLEVAAVWVTSGLAALVGRRQDDGKWTTPAGHLEPNEDPAVGAARELWEEAGIRAKPADLQKLGARRSGKYLVHCFSLDLPDQVEVTADHDPDEEIEEWRWVPLEGPSLPPEIQDNLHVPPNRNALLQALGMAKSESMAVAPGTWRGGEELAVLRPHPVGRDWQVVWSDSSGELGRTPPLSKAEAGGLIGQWLAKADGDGPAPAVTPIPAATKKPRAPKAPKVKPEPEKSLVVQHNISERGLANAHKIGGLPAPSLAVAHRDNPLTGFGEISLVAHPSMVDPKNKVPLFDSDVYSPRYPRTKRKINERAARQLEQELKPHLEETNRMGLRSFQAHDVLRDLEREQPEDFAQKRHGVAAALGLSYLRSKGENVELPPEGPPEMEDIPQKYTFTHRMNGLKGVQIPAEGPIDLPIKQKVAAEMHRLIEEDVRKQGAEKGWTPEQTERKIGISKKLSDLGEMVDGKFQPWPADDPIDSQTARDVLNDINNMGKQRPKEKPPRDEVMADMVHERVRDDPGFKQYLRDKLGPLQGEEYIEVGDSGRKVPHTLENVLKVLTSKVRGGEESAFGGLGQARAAGSKQFRSLEQAKQEGGRLVSKQKMEEAKELNEEHFGRMVAALTPHHASFKDGKNAYGRYDNAAGVVQDFLKFKNMDRALAASGYKPGDVPEPVKAQVRQFAQELTSMPTEYFEAKPQRAVGLHEFRGAAVPHDTSPQTLDILRQHGLRVEPYKKGDEEDRKRVIQKLAQEHDLMLSEKVTFSHKKGDGDGMVTAKLGGKKVGELYYIESQGRPEHHIESIGVLPSMQGKGIGSGLLRTWQKKNPHIKTITSNPNSKGALRMINKVLGDPVQADNTEWLPERGEVDTDLSVIGGNTDAFTRHTVKSLSKNEIKFDAISNLMCHPDPAERAMALKMTGVGRRHLAQALLSRDPALTAAALAHPALDAETIGTLAGSSGRWAEKRALLARPDLSAEHLEQMVRSALQA